ncbi:hypothetical protein JCM10212_007084 [Sporobolomyces blumeae]
MPPSSSSKHSSRTPSVNEQSSLLPSTSSSNPSRNTSNTRIPSLIPGRRGDSDVDSASSSRGRTKRDSNNGQAKRDYGTSTPSSREDRAFSTLPARLSRAASLDRQRSSQAKETTKWQKYQTRAKYYVPVLLWLPQYTFHQFIHDAIAALTITSMTVPQAMSYSTNLVHSTAVHGLFGVSIPSIIYSLFGTCRQLSIGPEAPLSLLMGEVIAKFIEQEEHAHGKMSKHEQMRFTAALTSFIVFEAGAISFLLGFFRLGFLDAVLSQALLRGFITAVGVIILISQSISILGLDAALSAKHGSSSSTVEKFKFLVTHLGDTNKLTVLVSGVAIVILIGMKVIKAKLKGTKRGGWVKYVPEVLIVVIGSTLFSHVFNWSEQGLEVLGEVSSTNVKFQNPFKASPSGKHYTDYAQSCIGTAAVVAILGFLESIVAAKDTSSKLDYSISPNRELTALGFANLSAGFVSGTLPGYGSLTRSRLAAATGATTQFAAFLTGAFTLGVTFGLLGLLRDLPKCILAVIVAVVVYGILEECPQDIRFFWKMRAWTDGGMMILTFLLSLFISVEVGIITSVSLSMVLCIKHSTLTHIKILGRIPDTDDFAPLVNGEPEEGEEAEHDYSNSFDLFAPTASNIQQGSKPVFGGENRDQPDAAPGADSTAANKQPQEEVPGVLVIRLRDVSLHFANTSALKERLRRLEKYGPRRAHPAEAPKRAEASVVVFEMKDVVGIDPGAARVLEEVVKSYADRDVIVYWVQPQVKVLGTLRQAGIIEASGGDDHLQPSVAKALETVEDRMREVAARVDDGSDVEDRV